MTEVQEQGREVIEKVEGKEKSSYKCYYPRLFVLSGIDTSKTASVTRFYKY